MSLSDFEQIKQLGKGAFGTVILSKRKSDGQKYAMKRVKIAKMNTKDQTNALNEVRVLASLNHPNVIDYKEAFYDDESSSLNIIMEYAEEGDLQSKIKQSKANKTYIAENHIWSYLIQMIHGLKSLHDKKIMHRDLKSANVFLMKNGTIKIGDLNVSKVVKMGFLNTQTGTPYYASPEVWSEKPYDYKSDLWSVGCIVYELCALRPPFRGQSLEQLFKSVIKGIYDPVPSMYSKELQQVIAMLLQVTPAKRPSCDAFLQNSIIAKKIDYSSYSVCTGQLISTIKLPARLEDINSLLPQLKRYGEKRTNESNVPFLLENKTQSSTNLNLVTVPSKKNSNKSVPPKELRSNLVSHKPSSILKPSGVINIRPSSSKDKILINNRVNIKRLSSDKKLLAVIGESKRLGAHISPLAVIDLFKRSPESAKNNGSSNSKKQNFSIVSKDSSVKEKAN